MIDILKRTIKNRFQVLIYVLNEQNSKYEKQLFFIVSILLEDFLFFPEKKDMNYLIQFLNDIQIKQLNENIRYHISIIKRDLDTFFNTFSKKHQTKHLKILDDLTKRVKLN